MHELYELKEKLCDELEEYGSKEMTSGSLEVIDKLAHAIKNLDKIIEKYEESEGYSSEGGMGYGSYGRSYEGSYEGSYARGGNRGGGRGRSNRSMAGRGGRTGANQYGSYARGGYSGNEGMIAELRELMMEAPDERSRKEFERFISKMEQM